MAFDIVPSSFWRFPTVQSLWDDEENTGSALAPSGLSISEDESHVYIEVAVPGIEPNQVEITFDKGVLWVKAEAKEEKENKKYYRKATRSFSYRVTVPGDIDNNTEPEATAKNGMMHITFTKSKASQPKKITVKS